VQVLVPRHELAERLRREQRLDDVERTALVDVDESPPQHRPLDHQLVFGADQIPGGGVHRLPDRHELRFERAHGTRGHVRLTIEIRDFSRQIVHGSTQLPHASLELGALAPQLLEPTLLGAQSRLGRLLLRTGDRNERDAASERCREPQAAPPPWENRAAIRGDLRVHGAGA
jgi:hypothetical protein